MQQCHNAVPSDEEWPFGHNLFDSYLGTQLLEMEEEDEGK
jgi:hypothetical protein